MSYLSTAAAIVVSHQCAQQLRSNAFAVSSAAGTHPCLSAIVVLCILSLFLMLCSGSCFSRIQPRCHAPAAAPESRVDIVPTHRYTAQAQGQCPQLVHRIYLVDVPMFLWHPQNDEDLAGDGVLEYYGTCKCLY